jgi:hypothetical protein
MGNKVFLICPVRGITDGEKMFLHRYSEDLEQKGYKVYFPYRDTNQNDPIGLRICTDNRKAIMEADEIHVYWNQDSEASRFDFGMAFMAEKPIKLINIDNVQKTPKKSLQNVLIELDSKYKL